MLNTCSLSDYCVFPQPRFQFAGNVNGPKMNGSCEEIQQLSRFEAAFWTKSRCAGLLHIC